MRIIWKDMENDRIKLQTENLNDLWHLQHLISPNDIVTAYTWRRPESESDKIRPDRREKERVKLTIRVKEVEFQEFSNKLRVLGTIKKGPDLGDHHTINIDTDTDFTLTKDWESDQLERLEEAKKASKRPTVLLVAADDETASFGLVRQYGLEELTEIKSTTSGKMYESDREKSESEYYGNVCSAIRNYYSSEDIQSVIVAGPGFAKKEIHSVLKEKYPEIAENTHLGATSHTGRSGLNEIIRRGIVKRVSNEDRTSKETELVEKLMEEVSKDGKGTYGIEKVREAIDAGAVDKLLVADKILREEREDVRPLMEDVRDKGGKVVVISSEHDSGKQFLRMSGLGALLRYKLF